MGPETPARSAVTAPPEYDDRYVLEVCFSPEGVDRTLILEALALSVEGRLERLRAFGASLLELRRAYEATRLG